MADRPIVTAGLGIVFALLLLVILSSPVLLGGMSNAPASSPADNLGVTSFNSGTTVITSTTVVSTTLTMATTVQYSSLSSVSTNNSQTNASNSSSTPTASSTVYYNASTTTVESSTTANLTVVAPQELTTITQVSTITYVTNSQSFAPLGLFSRSIVSSKGLLFYVSLLSVAALAIGLGGMFYVRRRVDSDGDASDQEPASN
ncbi:MAG: hypothetical protein M1587_09175 [Thaumarchaeota archaeon]|nr:hypothetical protein [Nitrososphaerota archaeon]